MSEGGQGGLVWLRRMAPGRLVRTLGWLRAVWRRHQELRRQTGLTVAVDIDPLYLPLTGVGWYLRMLLEQLRDQPGVHLRLYGPALHGFDGSAPLPTAPVPEGVALDLVTHPLREDLAISPWLQRNLLRVLQPILVRRDRNQVVFAPNFVVPRRLRWAGGALVVMVHDLAMRRVPETLAAETRALLDGNLDRALARAERLLTPSSTVRQEIIDEGLFAAERVHAILHGPGHLAVQVESDDGNGLRDGAQGIVLHVGTVEPRKNLALLLEVWEAAHQRAETLPQLVWCGRVGWKSEELMERAQRGIDAGWLVHHGYVDDALLRNLYREALCVVVPSRYEGFGLPLVEAMALGVPVVCSDLPVFREVVADAALLMPLQQPAQWEEALRRVAQDSQLREQLVRAGKRRAEGFDWQRAATATLDVWRQAVGQGSKDRADPSSTAVKGASSS